MKISRSLLILILGSMTALSPFSIDMYLSAFPMMAEYFQTDVARVSITLSSYFIGIASGQLIYGPLMDRFGRRKPLFVGLLIYISASVACMFAKTVDQLIMLRFIQGIGGCAASVGAFAMVRDLFDPKESAKVFSLLILILGVSPLLAPTIGGYLAIYFGWTSVFLTLAIGSTILLLVVMILLPESHKADSSHVLRPLPIIKNYFSIIKDPIFLTYALAGALAFSGLFVYLAASPTIFMEIFKVSEKAYGWIFAFIAMGMVGMSQLNVVLLRKYSNQDILRYSFSAIAALSFVFFICAYMGWYNLYVIIGIMFLFLSFMGLSNPNSSALAMGPFGMKAGSAAAMLGFLQMGIGSVASVMVGVLKAQQLLPLSGIFLVTSFLALGIFLFGSRVIASRKLQWVLSGGRF